MKYLILFSMVISGSAIANPIQKFELDVYKFAVSKNEDCSDMKVIIDHGSIPKRVNLVNNPSFGTGYVEPGTYNCVALEIARRMHVTPNNPPAGVGSCIHGQSSPIFIGYEGNDVDYQNFLSSMNLSDRNTFRQSVGSYLIGATDQGTDVQEGNSARMAMYLTTDQDAGNFGECFYIPTYIFPQPSSMRCGVKIDQPLVITGNESASFITRIIDPNTAIDNSEVGSCNVTDIEFDFVQ